MLTRWVLTGTHQGEYLGVPATGRSIRVTGMSLDRTEDGLVAEGFDGWDALELRRQLGLYQGQKARGALKASEVRGTCWSRSPENN